MTPHEGCAPCALEAASAESIVFRDDTWAIEIPTGYEAPGWYFLRLRRHAEGWSGLTPDEAAGFGAISQRIEGAIREATGTSKVYFMTFGENHPHFHFLVIAKPLDLDPQFRGAAIVSHFAALKDPTTALAVAATVRNAIALEAATT